MAQRLVPLAELREQLTQAMLDLGRAAERWVNAKAAGDAAELRDAEREMHDAERASRRLERRIRRRRR